MENEFDYYRILKVDYAAYFELWLMILPWFLYLFISYCISKLPDIHWTMVAVLISLVGFVLLVRRMRSLKNLCFQGLDVNARVTSTHAYRRGGSFVEIVYVYQAEKYQTINELRTSSFYNYSFREDDEVPIRLNPKKPTEAVIRDVYFSVDKSRSQLLIPKLLESKTVKKLYDRVFLILPGEFVFADLWSSDRIDTNLSNQQFMDAIVELGRQKYALNEKRDKIMLRNNFTVKVNTVKLLDKNIITLEFHRYYHRFYAVYFTIALIFALVATPYVPFARALSITFIISLSPIAFIWMAYEAVRGIRNIKPIDYGKEAEKVYYEILDAVREKEKEIA
ncbi:MAG: DUF3592 domain-containing protein [Methanolobus sp.]